MKKLSRMKLTVAALLLAAVVVVVPYLEADTWFYNRSGTELVGDLVPVVNVQADSLILDGTWLMADTTTTSGVQRFGVKPWSGLQTADNRLMGIAYGPIKKGSEGGRGMMLIRGYHPTARMQTGIAAWGAIGPSYAAYGMGTGGVTVADTLTIQRNLGYLITYNGVSTNATVGQTAQIWVNGFRAINAN